MSMIEKPEKKVDKTNNCWAGKKCVACDYEPDLYINGNYYCPWHGHLNAMGDKKYWHVQAPPHLMWKRDWEGLKKWIDRQQIKNKSFNQAKALYEDT